MISMTAQTDRQTTRSDQSSQISVENGAGTWRTKL